MYTELPCETLDFNAGALIHIPVSFLQIVQEISKRYGLPFGSKDVQPSNGDGKNGCSEDAVKHYYDAIALQNIALQYSMDVQRFGYL